jgi:hypothetical protein
MPRGNDEFGLRELLEQFAHRRQLQMRAFGQRLRALHVVAGAREAGHDDGGVVGEFADAKHGGAAGRSNQDLNGTD